MGDAPDNHTLSERIAVLEERMNAHQATYEKALERFERRMAERDARAAERDAALSERMATAADRMASSRWWQTAIIIAAIAALITFAPDLQRIAGGP